MRLHGYPQCNSKTIAQAPNLGTAYKQTLLFEDLDGL